MRQMNMAASLASITQEKTASGAGYLLFMLTAACLLSFVDRYTLNVLLGSIKSSMHLSDVQIGLLVASPFPPSTA